jgi:hypothetical protein
MFYFVRIVYVLGVQPAAAFNRPQININLILLIVVITAVLRTLHTAIFALNADFMHYFF